MMKKAALVLAVVCILGGGLGLYLQKQLRMPPAQPQDTPVLQPIEASPPVAASAPAIRHPIEAVQATESSTPAVSKPATDQDLWDILSGMIKDPTLARLIYPDILIRRIVATVDNLPREQVAPHLLPLKPASGLFLASGEGKDLAIAPENYARYANFMRVADTLDPHALARVYISLYPLFQRAYVELGYPKGYFNDRLVEAIDNLLATPEVSDPIKLVQPKVLFNYADPALQTASAGQKIMLRIGPDNAARIKEKLRAFRKEIAR